MQHPVGYTLSEMVRTKAVCLSIDTTALKPTAFIKVGQDNTLPIENFEELVNIIEDAVNREKERGEELGPGCQSADSCHRLCESISAALQAYATNNAGDWMEYAFFNQHHYVRNLVVGNEDFELMVLCWEPGQFSRVHNHSSSHCWLTPLHSTIQEDQYELDQAMISPRAKPVTPPSLPGAISAEAPCPPLTHTCQHELRVGQVSYINDSLALHSVGNPAAEGTAGGLSGAGVVTLHCYCPPIRRVRLYESAESRVVQRTPGFFTVGGIKV